MSKSFRVGFRLTKYNGIQGNLIKLKSKDATFNCLFADQRSRCTEVVADKVIQIWKSKCDIVFAWEECIHKHALTSKSDIVQCIHAYCVCSLQCLSSCTRAPVSHLTTHNSYPFQFDDCYFYHDLVFAFATPHLFHSACLFRTNSHTPRKAACIISSLCQRRNMSGCKIIPISWAT